MTSLKKPVRRVSNSRLDCFFGADRNKRIVVTLIPGNGTDVDDTIELRPERTQRPEYLKVSSAYRLAMMNRLNGTRLEQARAKKARQAAAKVEAKRKREIRALNRQIKIGTANG